MTQNKTVVKLRNALESAIHQSMISLPEDDKKC